MVAGKFKQAMGLQKSPSHHPPRSSTPSPSPTTKSSGTSTSSTQKSSLFSRSFGAYLPRSSAQVQPRPPDVSDLLRLVEELREREHRLKTELLEHKLLKEVASIVPALESEIASKSNDLEIFAKRIGALESENQSLIHQCELLMARLEDERTESRRKVQELESELAEARRKLLEKADELSASQRLLQVPIPPIEASSAKSVNPLKTLSAKKVAARSIDGGAACTSSNVESSSKSVLEETKKEDSRSLSSASATVRSRVPRVPKPPPKPISSSSCSSSSDCSLDDQKGTESSSITIPPPPPPAKSVQLPPANSARPPPPPPPPPPPSKAAPPPPPPPPPANGIKSFPAKVRRVPEVVEFYHSLMRRDSRRDSGAGLAEATATSARDLVGEIENRSTYLSAIKTDVETQGDFILFLIKEVENASFTSIEDVVVFVKWLDDELSYLVDERAVLKHFSWPEQKADALREAAFEYCDLKKLEAEASRFKDDPRQACSLALKKMQTLFDKLEHGVYNLSRLRESAANRFKSFNIPVDWMLDTGFVSQIKLASMKLAMKYVKRVSAELKTVGGGPEEEELIVQGVRFAFRVHQFAGGFDMETMSAFQELRDKASTCQGQQQRLLCRPVTQC